MPPMKKTKPNEKCPCGSGKKHKKCCMVAAMVAASSTPPPPTATAVLDEMMAALTLNITATNTAAAAVAAAAESSSGPCCHGSTSAHFPDGRAYSDVIKGILAVQKDGKKKILKFNVDNKVYLKDLNFVRYIFALCTSWYLKTKTTNGDMKILLSLATVYKYFHDDADKVKRYGRALSLDRGVINCLSRETKSFCDCMQAKKMEAKGMAKTEFCCGCGIIFPRKNMLICSGCKLSGYCNEDCQTKNWPKHREYCGL